MLTLAHQLIVSYLNNLKCPSQNQIEWNQVKTQVLRQIVVVQEI